MLSHKRTALPSAIQSIALPAIGTTTLCAQQPASYPRRILLAVTGLSPQVVTETLYALAVSGKPAFIPTEVHLITTAEGAERARLMLLDAAAGRFFQFLEEYSIDPYAITFDETHIHVVNNTDGIPLTDIQTEADNSAVANAITEKVRTFTEDDGCALHASIAGGRKTMGFYLGYALSLYGRAQDRLSHVLVNPPFDSHHHFYYPPATPRRLMIRERPAHTRDARVMLADIPFVRLRNGLPTRLQTGGASFSETITAAQTALEPAQLVINLTTRQILAGSETIKLPTADFAFYAWLAWRQLHGHEPVRWTDTNVQHEYLELYQDICGEMSQQPERTETALQDGFTKEWMEQRKSKTNAALRKALGETLAEAYLIHSHGKRPHTRSGISLTASAILIQPQTPACDTTQSHDS
ncbi:MAG: CRISPR-associated ring nuclease Csm6 [Granulosicoccus sp.]